MIVDEIDVARLRGAAVLARAAIGAAALASLPSCLVQRTGDAKETRPVDDRSRRRKIIHAVALGGARLRKDKFRHAMKSVVPLLAKCYEHARARDPQISGVINTKLTIHNEPRLGMILSVNGFDTHGQLGESREFLDCVTSTLEASVLPPIETRGTLDLTYPTTFAPQPPDNRNKGIVDVAARAAADGRWGDALEKAERGLELTSLDGTFRRRLIEVAGLSACHLKDEEKARHYFSLASPQSEQRLDEACLRVAAIDLTR